jgi:ABC-2 type transport system ATP-binding protein
MNKLSINNLQKKFGSFEAVKKISFSIAENQTVALLGPNGSISINNQILKKDHHYLSKMNFASPYVELPKKLTVLENLKVYAMMYEVPDTKNRIEQLVEELNLAPILNKKTGELSSGQRNRVSLAKSIINNPEILLLDEPTASLDPDTGDFIRTFLENYKKKNSMATLLASHNMDEVSRLSDYVLMMKEGSIIDEGTALNLISKHGKENLEQVFLKLVRQNEN